MDGLCRHALITGGSSGLGYELARALLASGAAVTIVARDRGRLSDAHARLSAQGGAVRALSCDVTDGPALAALAAEAERHGGPVDFAAACAGAARPGRVETLTPEIFRSQMEVNYFGALNLGQAVLPKMRARGRGALLFVSSAAGLIGLPGHAAYAPSKFAVRALAQALGHEARPDGVLVSCAFPADLDTPGYAEERPFVPPELHAIAGSAGLMRADRCARRILKGMQKGREEIHPTLTVGLLARLGPLVRPLLVRHIDKVAAKARLEAAWDDRIARDAAASAPPESDERGR